MARKTDNLDTRDLQERIDELEEEVDGQKETAREAWEVANNADPRSDADQMIIDQYPDVDDYIAACLESSGEADELKKLNDLKDEFDHRLWKFGIILIAESNFKDEAMRLAEDTIVDFNTSRWPFTHIDWEAAANDLQSDYSSVEYDGETYWYRD